jgi:hypothetical protein
LGAKEKWPKSNAVVQSNVDRGFRVFGIS